MISSLLHLVGLRPRVYYTLTNFRGGGGAKAPLAPPSIRQCLLFLLCINDLPNVSDTLFAILFADNTSDFLERNALVEITHILNAELAKLTTWLSTHSYFF